VRLARLLAIMLIAQLYGCASIQPSLPSITETPTGTHHPGKIIWHDLITHTPEASKRFYSELFGWEFEDLGLDFGFGRTVNYSLIRHQGELIGGMIDANHIGRPNPRELSQWVVVMSVADLEAAVESVKAGGGKVLAPARDVSERGRIALIEDNQGAALALLQTRDGDPADRVPPVGDFLWDEVWPDDLARSLAFYKQLTGLRAAAHVTSSERQYQYMATASTPRFGLVQQPVEELSPTWVSYVRVQQPERIISRVAELGGRVLLPVEKRDVGGEVALIAGPSGAGFAIQTWTGNRTTALIQH
jgi:predicted enzyme related to lactoylglutathione lyase